jgi:hypothetical protein
VDGSRADCFTLATIWTSGLPTVAFLINSSLLLFSVACSLASGARVARAVAAREHEVSALVVAIVALAQIVGVLQFSGFVVHTFSPFVLTGLHILATAAVVGATRTPLAQRARMTERSDRDSFAFAAFGVTGLAPAALAALVIAAASPGARVGWRRVLRDRRAHRRQQLGRTELGGRSQSVVSLRAERRRRPAV